MTSATEKPTNEARLRALLSQWREAVSRKDIDGVMAPYAPDMVGFDAWGGLRLDVNTYRDHWEQCFAGHEGPIRIEHHELDLVAGDDVAFCRCLIHMVGTLKDGTKNDFRGRATICFQKIDDQWLVSHEHASVPFDPMTGQACTNLQP